MKKKSLLENYIYNSLFQVFRIISPVITIPYISRVLESDGIGAFAYTNSIVTIFILCGALGINLYGSRLIAYSRDDFDKRSRIFWELFFLNLFTSIVALIFYFIFIQFCSEALKQLYYIQILIFLTSIFEISWYFTGQEDFKKISIRLFLTRFLGIIAVFIFVNTKNDLPLYTFIISFSGILGNLFLWFQLKNEIKFKLPGVKNLFKHFIPSFNMFMPLFATFVFGMIDKIMVGKIAGLSEAGVYEMGDRLIKVILPLAVSLAAVMMPRMTNSIANKEYEKVNFYITKSLSAVSYLSIPICIGVIAVSKEFIPWFLGDDFTGTYLIMNILAFAIILNAWNSVTNTQVLIPYGKEKICALIIFIGLIIKIFINLLIIPEYKAVGAGISTIIAEVFITILFFCFAAPYMKLKNFYREFFIELAKFSIAAMLFYLPVRIIGSLMGVSCLTTAIQVLAGMFIYFAVIILLKSSTHKFVIDKAINLFFKKINPAKLRDEVLIDEK